MKVDKPVNVVKPKPVEGGTPAPAGAAAQLPVVGEVPFAPEAHGKPAVPAGIYQPNFDKGTSGKKAQVDLREWNPHALREAHLRDAEIVFRMLRDLPPAITFYGGARIKEDDPYFALSREIGALLAKCGVPVRTGAGPGMMTSVLEGFDAVLAEMQKSGAALDPKLAFPRLKNVFKKAVLKDLRTQGFRIALPFEQEWSKFVHVGAQQELFPLRKQALRDNARGLVTLPGGYGSLDELFEGWALSGLGQHHQPMAIVGKHYYGPLLAAIEKVTTKDRALMPESEFKKVLVTDDPQELVDHLRTNSGGGFEKDPPLRYKRIAREIDETVALLDKLPPAVTFIGGRSLKGPDPALDVAQQTAALLTQAGIALRVGGLADVAGAVARGAASADKNAEVQGLIVGKATDATANAGDLKNVRIHQALTELVAHKECIGRRSKALVALPGGMGTLSELFAVLTQVQCGHLPKTPIVLVGKSFWQPIFDAIKQVMLTDTRQTIAPHDLDLVTITDDPAEIARIVAAAESASALPPPLPSPLPSSTLIAAPTGQVPPWLTDSAARAPAGANGQHSTARPPTAEARTALEQALPQRIVDMLDAHGVDPADAAHVLFRIARTPESGARKIATLLAAGAGPETFRMIVETAPYCHYKTPIDTALDILDRWGKDAETVCADLALLATSNGMRNPDALKIPLNGIAADGPAGEGFATVVSDAAALISAGHQIYLEEHPGGLGDLIDVTEGVTYQVKRVTSSHLGAAMNAAARQLTGDPHADPPLPGAPADTLAVVLLDARNNRELRGLSDAEIIKRLQDTPVPDRARLDRVHVHLDGRTLIFDRARTLLATNAG